MEILSPEELRRSGEGRVIDVRDSQISIRDDASSLVPLGTYDPRGHYQFAPKAPKQNCKVYVPIGIDHREQRYNEDYPIIIASTTAPRIILIPVNGRMLFDVLLDDFTSFEANLEFDMKFLDPRSLTADIRHVEVMGHKSRIKLDYARFVDTVERVNRPKGLLGRLNLAKVGEQWVSISPSGLIQKVHPKNPIVTDPDGELGFGTLKKTIDGDICIFTPNNGGQITVFSQNGEQMMVIDGVNKLIMYDTSKLRRLVQDAKAEKTHDE